MFNKKPKFCKCGHKKESHLYGKLKAKRECRECPCTEYFKRDLPKWYTWFSLAYGIFMFSIIAVVIGSLGFLIVITDGWDLPIELSAGAIFALIAGLFAFLTMFVYDTVMRDYFVMKRRKAYPMSEP